MIKNILFDMGNVLIRFDKDFFMSRLGASEEDKKLLLREVFNTVEWVQIDRGSISEEEATAQVCRRLPKHLHDTAWKLITMWERPILPIEGMYEVVRELKENGYGIYLLSNACIRHREYWPRVPASRFFDGRFISSEEKLLKPELEFYHRALERFRLRPEECHFIDDSPANIEAAMRCGIPGTIFRGDAKLLRRELQAAGIQIHE